MIIELEKTCDLCGQKFRNKRIDAIFCSSACRQKANRLKKMQENASTKIEEAKAAITEDVPQKNKKVQQALNADRELADLEIEIKRYRDELIANYEKERAKKEDAERHKREKKEAEHKLKCSSVGKNYKSTIDELRSTIDELQRDNRALKKHVEKYIKLSDEVGRLFSRYGIPLPSLLMALTYDEKADE